MSGIFLPWECHDIQQNVTQQNDIQHDDAQHNVSTVILSVIYGKCQLCRVSQISPFYNDIMMNVVIPSVFMLSIVAPNCDTLPFDWNLVGWKSSALIPSINWTLTPSIHGGTAWSDQLALNNIWPIRIWRNYAFYENFGTWQESFPPAFKPAQIWEDLDPMLSNFFVRNWQIFVIIESVCPWQAFEA